LTIGLNEEVTCAADN